MRPKNTPNDPERRQRIAQATVELIVREGIAAVTSRAVAREAGVPLGSVSYHFDSVHALLVEAARTIMARRQEGFRSWEQGLTAATVVEQLAGLIHDQITTGRALTVAAYELYVVGLRDEKMRSAGVEAIEALRTSLHAVCGVEDAEQLAAAADGLQLQGLLAAVPPEVATLTRQLSANYPYGRLDHPDPSVLAPAPAPHLGSG